MWIREAISSADVLVENTILLNELRLGNENKVQDMLKHVFIF